MRRSAILLTAWLALALIACSESVTRRDAAGDDSLSGVDAGRLDGLSVDSPVSDLSTIDLPPPAEAGAWVEERWTVLPFTEAMGRGPRSGPAAQVGDGVHALKGDSRGNIFISVGQQVDIVTPDGERVPLAGTGWEGFRDGPAHQAEFRMGTSNYYQARNIQLDERGNIFVPDSGNRRVRRIFHDGQAWQVETWAGGGETDPAKGATVAADEVQLPGAIMIATAPDGRTTVCGTYNCYSISSDGTQVTGLGGLPATLLDPNTQNVPKMNLQMGDSDIVGNHYFVTRTPDLVVRVTPRGEVEHIAGLMAVGKPHDVGDGPPLDAYFDTPESMAACPHGECVYVCGGDEYDIRRVPTDKLSTTATLMMNGSWYQMSVHPNANRGDSPSTFDPDATGLPRPEGGTLYNLMNCHICGRNYVGDLFGYLYPWRGPTLKIAGEGYLPTRVYRIQRSAP